MRRPARPRAWAGADTAAVRWRFIARQDGCRTISADGTHPWGGGGRGGATRLKVYLSLLWLARNRTLERPVFSYPAKHLAALIGLPHPDGAGARRVQEALRWLAKEGFVALDRRPGDVTHVHLLDDAGSGDPCRAGPLVTRAPKRSQSEREQHFYVQLDARFWTKGWVSDLRRRHRDVPGLPLRTAGAGQRDLHLDFSPDRPGTVRP